MPDDLEIRALRYYVAVAEELHFTRAAQRLFVAQQALSRQIQRLEDRVGTRLLDRTTRHVTLTPAGEALLTRARELIALHDTTMRELRGEDRPLTVDVVGPGLTPALVLAAARERAQDVEFFVRFHTGAEAAAPLLLTDRLDVTFGRHHTPVRGIRQRPVRHERLAVLLPATHPLAESAAVPLESLRGTGVCIRAGNHATAGWEHAMLQLLASFNADPLKAHPHVHGADELAHHIHDRDAPILTMSTQPDVPGAVLRPVIEPVPLFPWAMMWRADLTHPGLTALHEAVASLAAEQNWLTTPAEAWLPQPEATHVS